MAQPTCSKGCRMVLITPNLWLCPHASYGSMVSLRGAVEEGRRLMQQAGGYQKIRDQLDKQDQERAQEKAEARERAASRRRQLTREV
jgi:hypothetical protein